METVQQFYGMFIKTESKGDTFQTVQPGGPASCPVGSFMFCTHFFPFPFKFYFHSLVKFIKTSWLSLDDKTVLSGLHTKHNLVLIDTLGMRLVDPVNDGVIFRQHCPPVCAAKLPSISPPCNKRS